MPVVHFLNVKDGDCSIIEHYSGRVTVIDVCNAEPTGLLEAVYAELLAKSAMQEKGISGNFNQKNYPVNPIRYLKDQQIDKVFRFILTHPDMDHMDGIKAFFDELKPLNFWDTDNQKESPFEGDGENGYKEDDWDFYQNLRDAKPQNDPKRLALHSGRTGHFWSQNEKGEGGGDGIQILAPTPDILRAANESGEYNDSSYVLLYKTGKHRILFAGDSHDATWEHILKAHKEAVSDVDVLIAPHHGRHSGRDWEFLDVVNPALTLFGNAPSEHLAYDAWNNRDLPFITNNQAGCVVLNAEVDPIEVYVTCEAFAKKLNPSGATFNKTYKGYYVGTPIPRKKKVAVAG